MLLFDEIELFDRYNCFSIFSCVMTQTKNNIMISMSCLFYFKLQKVSIQNIKKYLIGIFEIDRNALNLKKKKYMSCKQKCNISE
jgi:hypothetical protein